jgi:hypothetical protein
MASLPWRIGLALVVVAAAVGAWVWIAPAPPLAPPPPAEEELRPDPPPPDPRETFETPYRNVKPGVKYVGDAACAGCHPAIDASYHQHPMGRSAARVGATGAPEDYTSPRFAAQGYDFRVEKTPAGDRHVASAKDGAGNPLPDHVLLATIAVGSGTRGRSYLAIEDGSVFQTPISWFGQGAGKWDLSPGFDLGRGGRRPIRRECLFCHVNQADIAGGVNRLAAALPEQLHVGCERCHGPGELHVTERTANAAPTGIDTAIVNPKHLSADLRSGVCRQCHLQGEARVVRRGRDVYEYRPGLPWEAFVNTHVRHPTITDYHHSVGQFEQMHVSKCFTASAGKLDCVSCHDPHAKPGPANAAAFYRTRCLTCHETKGCTAPAADRATAADSCVACHMPRDKSSNVPHTATTDHRVLRRPAGSNPPSALPPGADPLVVFAASRHVPPAEQDRDLGVGFADALRQMPRAAAVRSPFVGRTRADLEQTLTLWPGDRAARLAAADVHALAGDPDLSVRAARAAVRLDPKGEDGLAKLADALLAAGRYADAGEVADRLVGLNPRLVDYRTLKVMTLLPPGEWAKAEAACRDSLAVHPHLPATHLYLALCRHKQGDAAGGRAGLDTAVGLTPKPDQKAEYRRWYADRTR